jgi:hypothetical protein
MGPLAQTANLVFTMGAVDLPALLGSIGTLRQLNGFALFSLKVRMCRTTNRKW